MGTGSAPDSGVALSEGAVLFTVVGKTGSCGVEFVAEALALLVLTDDLEEVLL